MSAVLPLYAVFALLLAGITTALAWPTLTFKRWLTIFAAVSLLSLGGYVAVGTPQILALMEARSARLAELQADIAREAEAIKQTPHDAQSWTRLGVAFMEAGEPKSAANAFKQAVILTNGAPAVIMAYAKAQIAAKDGTVDDHAKRSLEMVLLQEADHEEARYWLAVRHLQDGNQEQAMKEMKSLYHSLPADSPLKARINEQIGRK